MLLFIFTVFAFVSFAVAAPQGCTKVSTSLFQIGKFNGTAAFSLDKDSNMLIVSNVTAEFLYTDPKVSHEICAMFEGEAMSFCTSNYSAPFKIPISNETLTSTFNLVAFFNSSKNTVPFKYFSGIFDEDSFTLDSGVMFSNQDSCQSDSSYDRHGILRWAYKRCCETFTSAIEAPKTMSSCTKLKTRATVYNVDVNYSIFATTQINYTISENNMTIYTDSFGIDHEGFYITLNNDACGYSLIFEGNCTFEIPDEDSKFLISAQYWNQTFAYRTDLPKGVVGRIIFRNNVPLMEEGMPFTEDNNCQFFNSDFSYNQILSSSFCCLEFDK